jgi:hypothetical protein
VAQSMFPKGTKVKSLRCGLHSCLCHTMMPDMIGIVRSSRGRYTLVEWDEKEGGLFIKQTFYNKPTVGLHLERVKKSVRV